MVIYLESNSDNVLLTETNIILIFFFAILLILLIHLIIRWLRVYSRSRPQSNIPQKPEVKLKKIPTPKYKLMVGGTYLILERTEKEIGQGFKTFKDIQRNDADGLVITRTFPEKVLKKYNLGDLPMIWLSRSKDKNAISPTNLGALIEEIKEFSKKHDNSIIMFDGLEYLTVHNEFERVLKFLHSLEDEIAVEKSRLIISLNPKTLSDKRVALLSKEMKILNLEQREKNAK